MQLIKVEDKVWRLDIRKWMFQLKAPKSKVYFSERNGYNTPAFKLFGWRLFIYHNK